MRYSDTTYRGFAASTLIAGLLALAPVTASATVRAVDPPPPGPSSSVAQRGWLCETGISCPSVYHTNRGVHRRIKVNCGTYENPGGNRRLSRGQSSKDPGKCGKRTNAIYVPAGFDFARCSKATPLHPLQCYPVYKSRGWHYLGDTAHLKLHVVHNGVCVEECAPGDS